MSSVSFMSLLSKFSDFPKNILSTPGQLFLEVVKTSQIDTK